MTADLQSIRVAGYRSIKDTEIKLRPINLLIGANGSGKSNLLSVFRMLNYLTSENLQVFVSREGGASSLLHYGAKATPQMSLTLEFATDQGVNTYAARLVHAAGDTLIFADEAIDFTRNGRPRHNLVSLGAGHRESLLQKQEPASAAKIGRTASVIRGLMNLFRFYHFHDTGPQAHVKQKVYTGDCRYLRDDAGNLAAFLLNMRVTAPDSYRQIVSVVSEVAPYFGDFALDPASGETHTILNWVPRHSETVFGPHQLSDGTIRMIALAALLLQPSLPHMIIIDEPELGLHPYAVGVLSDLIKAASCKTQLIIATQSVTLLDQFEPDDILVSNLSEGCTVIERLNETRLAEWLEDYTLSELWQKNVLGGRPGR